MTKIKVCANKSVRDAKACIDAGVDIIGILVGNDNEDCVSKEIAKEICDYVNGRCDVSLVTRSINANEIIDLTNYIGNNIIQLHSNIIESEVEKIVNALPDIKLVRVIHISKDGNIYSNIPSIIYADWYLLDSYDTLNNTDGGTGTIHDWNLSKEIIDNLDRPAFLAGGLNPYNVLNAINITRPYGVDVNSGCKDELGNKDYEKIKLFVDSVSKIDKLLDESEEKIEEDENEEIIEYDLSDEIDMEEDLN